MFVPCLHGQEDSKVKRHDPLLVLKQRGSHLREREVDMQATYTKAKPEPNSDTRCARSMHQRSLSNKYFFDSLATWQVLLIWNCFIL